MKNTLPRMFLILAASLLGYTCDTKQTDRQQQLATGIEEKIDLVKHPMSDSLGRILIATFKYSVLLDSVQEMPVTADSIVKEAFIAMKDSALKLQGNSTKSYLRAIRINYGLNATSKAMLLYYQPLFLKRIDSVGKSHIKFQPEASPYYYYYDNQKKKFVHEPDQSKITAAADRYAKHISFRKSNGKFRLFYPGQVDSSDVTACIFPFEEIEEMVKDNEATHVYIINAGEEIENNGKTYLRHVMLLGPDSLEHHIRGVFYRKYANLTHLCPPNCTQHFFDLK